MTYLTDDPSSVAAADPSAHPGTLPDPATHRRRYGARLQNTDDGGNVYFRLGYDQDQLREGLLRRVEAALPTRIQDSAFTLLEVGCSSGFLLDELAKEYPNAQLCGIDPSPVAIRQAQDLYGLSLICGTLATHSFEPKSFDVVLMLGNLMLHPHPERTLQTIYTLLKPGGMLVFDVKNPASTARLVLRRLSSIHATSRFGLFDRLLAHGYRGMRFGLSKELLTTILTDQGWHVSSVTTVGPRLLQFANQSPYSRNLTGLLWRLSDFIDSVRRQRAWIQAIARRPPD